MWAVPAIPDIVLWASVPWASVLGASVVWMGLVLPLSLCAIECKCKVLSYVPGLAAIVGVDGLPVSGFVYGDSALNFVDLGLRAASRGDAAPADYLLARF